MAYKLYNRLAVFAEHTTSPTILEAFAPQLEAKASINAVAVDPVNYQACIKRSKTAAKTALARSTHNQDILGCLISTAVGSTLDTLVNIRARELDSKNQEALAVRALTRANTVSESNVDRAVKVLNPLPLDSLRTVVRQLPDLVKKVHFKNGFIAQHESQLLATSLMRSTAFLTVNPEVAVNNHKYMDYSVAPLVSYAMCSGHDWATISKSLQDAGASQEAIHLTALTTYSYLRHYDSRLGFSAKHDEVIEAIQYLRENVDTGTTDNPDSFLWAGVSSDDGSWQQRALVHYNTKYFQYDTGYSEKLSQSLEELRQALKTSGTLYMLVEQKWETIPNPDCITNRRAAAANFRTRYTKPQSASKDKQKTTVTGLAKLLNSEVRKKLTSSLTFQKRIAVAVTSVANQLPLISEKEIPQLSPEVIALAAYHAYSSSRSLFYSRKVTVWYSVVAQWGALTRQAGSLTPDALDRINRLLSSLRGNRHLELQDVTRLRLMASYLVSDPKIFAHDPLLDMPWSELALHGGDEGIAAVTRVLDAFVPEDVPVWGTVNQFFDSPPEGLNVREVLALAFAAHDISVRGRVEPPSEGFRLF